MTDDSGHNQEVITSMNDSHHVYAIGTATFFGEALIWLADFWQYIDKGVVYVTHAMLAGAAYFAWRKARK